MLPPVLFGSLRFFIRFMTESVSKVYLELKRRGARNVMLKEMSSFRIVVRDPRESGGLCSKMDEDNEAVRNWSCYSTTPTSPGEPLLYETSGRQHSGHSHRNSDRGLPGRSARCPRPSDKLRQRRTTRGVRAHITRRALGLRMPRTKRLEAVIWEGR